MKIFWRLLLIITILLYLVSTAVFTIFHQQFKHLAIKDYVKPSHCVLVYNPGRDIELLKTAKQLLDKNPKSKLIYTPLIVNSDVNSLQLLKEVGIDKSKVVPEYYSTSMKASAVSATDLMHNENMNRCTLVGRDYEMKRLVATFKKNNPMFDFYHKAVQLNGKSYLDTADGRKKAEKELWQYPKLWLNR
ncbi:hypothetical protein [Macrococcus animalis]|uniref:hypothetical protein n=1 Tax=Macrococcus animalis TaxID=3395467 RepID=UPI0039BE55C7